MGSSTQAWKFDLHHTSVRRHITAMWSDLNALTMWIATDYGVLVVPMFSDQNITLNVWCT